MPAPPRLHESLDRLWDLAQDGGPPLLAEHVEFGAGAGQRWKVRLDVTRLFENVIVVMFRRKR